jgi:serine/threonine protein kinase
MTAQLHASRTEKSLQDNDPAAIGPYEIVTRLGSGAMGTVYKAHDPARGATVAIKLASAALSRDKVLVKRFEQEFRSTSNLDHPNIVRGIEFGWQGSRPYIVMEFVDGEDLGARIDRLGRLREAEAVDYISQVAQGLHEAHKNGIIHRDIKPDNILLTRDGQAKLTDLGLSKDLEAQEELTRPDRGLGTPNFIAPEQFSDAKHAGVRCDIYSLGATLYMSLTGELPFAASTISAMLSQKLANDLVAPGKLVPGLSPHVEWAIRRALLAEPEWRFSSCPEFIAALSGEPEEARASGNGKRTTSSSRPQKKARIPEKERRAAVRFGCALATSATINLSFHPGVTDCQTSWEAKVCDLSVTGIGLLLTRRFEPGSILTVDLTSSSGDTRRTREIYVVRVSPVDGGQWFLGATMTEKLTREELRRLL